MEKSTHDLARLSIQKMLSIIKEEIQDMDNRIAKLIKSHDSLSDSQNVVKQVKGIGPLMSAILLAELPELGRIGNKQISSLVGERWQKETIERSKRLPKGLKGIWYRITGKYQKIRSQNELETKHCLRRDRDERQALIERQLKERQNLQKEIRHVLQEHKLEIINLRQEIGRYMEMGAGSKKIIQEKLDQAQRQKSRTLRKDRDQGYEPEM